MIPHKTKRGMEALNRLKVYEGVPPPYDKVSGIFDCISALGSDTLVRWSFPVFLQQKRMVVPQALRVLKLRPGRKVCVCACVRACVRACRYLLVCVCVNEWYVCVT